MPSRIGKLLKRAKKALSSDDAPKNPAKKAVKKATPKKSVKKVAKKAATPAKKTTAKKSVKKSPKAKVTKATKKPEKKAAVKKATPKKSSTKKTTPKKTAKKAVKSVKKSSTKKPATKKATKKTPVKKVAKKAAGKKQTKKQTTKETKATVKKATKPAKKTVKKPKKPEVPKYKAKKTLNSLKLQNPKDQPWVPERSKIKAAIENGLPASYLHVQRVLYLGAAHGYTVSHIYTKPMEVYAVEKSREMMQHFLPVAENLPNVLPIFADAGAPDSFAHVIPGKVDLIFQDIAQKNQAQIFLSNCERFLAPHGVGILALKARNVNSTAEPAAVFAETRTKLEAGGATVVQEISLEPYQEGHKIFVVHMNPYMDW